MRRGRLLPYQDEERPRPVLEGEIVARDDQPRMVIVERRSRDGESKGNQVVRILVAAIGMACALVGAVSYLDSGDRIAMFFLAFGAIVALCALAAR